MERSWFSPEEWQAREEARRAAVELAKLSVMRTGGAGDDLEVAASRIVARNLSVQFDWFGSAVERTLDDMLRDLGWYPNCSLDGNHWTELRERRFRWESQSEAAYRTMLKKYEQAAANKYGFNGTGVDLLKTDYARAAEALSAVLYPAPREDIGTCPTCERVTYTVKSKNRLKSIEFGDGVSRIMCNGCRLAWYRLRDDGTEITWAEFQRRRKAGEHGNKYKPREKGWRGGPHPSVLRKQKAETP